MKFAKDIARRFAVALTLGLIGSLSAAYAQEFDIGKLLAVRSLKCTFPLGMGANWTSGKPILERSFFNAPLHFDSIDSVKGTARLIGNQGSGDLHVIQTPIGLTFVEMTPIGNLSFTTVFASQARGSNRLIAVHSRHMDALGPLPSQFHGTCEVWE